MTTTTPNPSDLGFGPVWKLVDETGKVWGVIQQVGGGFVLTKGEGQHKYSWVRRLGKQPSPTPASVE